MPKSDLQYKIIVLDDNAFYNKILTKRIKSYAEMLTIAFEKNFEFDIQSYTSAQECINDLQADTDIVFMDYFLDNKITAFDLLTAAQKKCKDCKFVIISQTKKIGAILQLYAADASEIEFICKDEDALSKSCMVVNDIVSERN